MNRVDLVGRWTKDVELRYTGSGTAVASCTLAVNRQFKREGEPDADFFRIIMWKKDAENAAQYTGKGHLVAVEGRLQNRSYNAQDGTRRQITEVVANRIEFLAKPNGGGNNTPPPEEGFDPLSGFGDTVEGFNADDLPF